MPGLPEVVESGQTDTAAETRQETGLGVPELAALSEILGDREVRYEDCHRKRARKTEVGTPQGSAASPSIWLMGINDMLVQLESTEN